MLNILEYATPRSATRCLLKNETSITFIVHIQWHTKEFIDSTALEKKIAGSAFLIVICLSKFNYFFNIIW